MGLKKKSWLIRKINLDSGIDGRSFWKDTVVPNTHQRYLFWSIGKIIQEDKKTPKTQLILTNFTVVF